ncbi:uncharacterized protein Rexo5 isoform X2 [Periplaneta americana]|uniref:uncharacterized protein Rexo5 isoform X2 n=1 Tax=Periplaneta americana TaxID=6978 RepID=UPI0037E89E8F
MLEGVTTFSNTKMKPLTSKQLQRIEKKKKKMAAYLEIAKLNDKDREAKALMHRNREESESSDADSNTGARTLREGPSRKRHKKDNDTLLNTEETTVDESSQPECPEDPPDQKDGPEPEPELEPVVSFPNNLPPGFSDHATGPSGKVQLSGDEFAQLKRELRERKNRLKCIPRFRLKEVGEWASLTVKEDERTPLFLTDIQHLLMCSMLGHHSPYQPSRWCQLEKYNRLSHTVVLLIEGLSLYDFQAHESLFPAITDNFSNRIEIITPLAYNGSIIEEMAAAPLTGTQKDRLLKQFGSLEVAMKEREDLFKIFRAIFPVFEPSWSNSQVTRPLSDRYSRTQLLLSPTQLVEENYPLPLKGELRARYADFVLTKDLYHEVTHNSPMFGLDCEMCRTTTGELELTRVSIVNEKLEVVYETYVKPYNNITDYLTRYSGITKELLSDVIVRLEDVQKNIKSLLPPDAILVGQSLNFDLMALKMMHPYVIDTSVIYNITGDRFRKTKLALLAHRFLGEAIQQGNKGHCSVEDSSTCMKLTQLKLANNLEYGDAILAGRRSAALAQHRQMQVMADSPSRHEIATSIFSHVTKMDKSAAIVGCEEVIDKYSSYMSESMISIGDDSHSDNKAVQCFVTENETVASQTCDIAREYSFTIAHIQVDRAECDNEIKMFKRVNRWCRAVWESIANNGMCVVILSGQQRGANGACFIQIKRPPTADHALTTVRHQ